MAVSLPPSFLFAGLDQETLSLNEELQALGGGDATTANMHLFCFVNDREGQDDPQTLWDYETSLGVRDVSLPHGSPASKSMQYLPVSGCARRPSSLSPSLAPSSHPGASNSFASTRLAVDLCDQLVDWVCDGFNACVLAAGLRGTAKTETLFGDFGLAAFRPLAHLAAENEVSRDVCLAQLLLEAFFHHKKMKELTSSSHNNSMNSIGGHRLTIALSCWSLQENKLVDLLAPLSVSADPLDFALVECPDLRTALSLLHDARSRCPGCRVSLPLSSAPSSSSPSTLTPEQANEIERDKAHFFMRIVLHSSSPGGGDIGTLSSLYLCDLVGLTVTETRYFSQTLKERERQVVRQRNVQLNTLWQVLQEMREISVSAANRFLAAADYTPKHGISTTAPHSGVKRVTSARSAKLTTLLAPILQGNMRTALLYFLRDGERAPSAGRALLNQLVRAQEIVTACYKCTDIPLQWLKLRAYSDTLPPHAAPHSLSSQSAPAHHSAMGQIFPSQHSLPGDDEVNLESILRSDFGESRASLSLPVPVHTPHRPIDSQPMGLLSLAKTTPHTTHVHTQHELHAPSSYAQSHTPVHAQTHTEKDKDKEGSRDVRRVMDEFHALLRNIQSTENEDTRTHTEEALPPSPSISLSVSRSHSQSHTPQSSRRSTRYTSMPNNRESLDVDFSRGEENANSSPSHNSHSPPPPSPSHTMQAYRETKRDVENSPRPALKNTFSPPLTRRSSSHGERDHDMSARRAWPPPSYTHTLTGALAASDSLTQSLSTRWPRETVLQSVSVCESEEPLSGKDREWLGLGGSDAALSVTDTHNYPPDETYNEIKSNTHSEATNGTQNTSERTPSRSQKHPHAVSLSDEEINEGRGWFASFVEKERSRQSRSDNLLERESDTESLTDSLTDASSHKHNHTQPPESFSQTQLHTQYNTQSHVESEKEFSPFHAGYRSPHAMSTQWLSGAFSDKHFDTHRDVDTHKNMLEHTTQTHSPSQSLQVDRSIASPSQWKSDTATLLAEIETLRRVNDSLTQALAVEKEQRAKADRRLQQIQDDLVEQRAQFEVDMDACKFENRELRQQIRRLCGEQNISDVCACFETDLQRLMRENEALRTRNLELEAKELDLWRGGESDGGKSPELSQARPQSQQHRLVERLKKSGQEREALKTAYETLKSKERQFLVNEKVTHDALRRLRVTHQELVRSKKEHETCKLVLMKRDAELQALQEDTRGVREREYALKEERARLLSEVHALRERVRDFEAQESRAIILSRFLNKHTQPSTSREKTKSNSRSTVDLDSSAAVPSKLSDGSKDNFVKAKIYAMNEALRTQEKQTARPHLSGTGETASVPGTVVGGLHMDTQRPHASYLRGEEKEALSAELELTVAAMHDSLASNAPSLLPLFRKLTSELQQERASSVEQRAKLLDHIITQPRALRLRETHTPVSSQRPSSAGSTRVRFANSSPSMKTSLR